MSKKNLPIEYVSEEKPCIHCSKPDWCYRLGDELSACKRNEPPAEGWRKTKKKDDEGTPYYAKIIIDQSWVYTNTDGQPLARVCRRNQDGKKRVWREYPDGDKWDIDAPSPRREEIAVYNYQKLTQGIDEGETIWIPEGEKCADYLSSLGLTATTNLGGSGKWRESDTKCLAGVKSVVLCPDRDSPGVKHMVKVEASIRSAYPECEIKWMLAEPNSPLWQALPESKGFDVANWQPTLSQLEQSIEDQPEFPDLEDTQPEEGEPQKLYTQIAFEELYTDKPWISLSGKLHFWNGTHYEFSPEPVERKRISDWCNSYVTEGKQRKYAYAKPECVQSIWKWTRGRLEVDPTLVNPPGMNLKNGRLVVNWENSTPDFELLPHDPDVYYTYVSKAQYEPDADPTDCNRLLEVLDEPQQEVFLRTIAASLDLATVRRFRGREVRAILCKGEGNNGKDALRECVKRLYGNQGVSACSLTDFRQYDSGRKFPLAKLANSKVNWSSESCDAIALDKIQSLKKAVTGDPLDVEDKGKDEYSTEPASVFFFNINTSPRLEAAMEAIRSRYAILSFDKVFKAKPDPAKGELQADPRFKHDPDFINEHILPALLNKVLDSLKALMAEGINYESTEQTLADVQRQSNHLLAFCQDVGLNFVPNAVISVKELWENLRNWYLENGTLEILEKDNGKSKDVFHDQPARGDKTIKAVNQVVARFLSLFPKAKRGRSADGVFIRGLKFGENHEEPMEKPEQLRENIEEPFPSTPLNTSQLPSAQVNSPQKSPLDTNNRLPAEIREQGTGNGGENPRRRKTQGNAHQEREQAQESRKKASEEPLDTNNVDGEKPEQLGEKIEEPLFSQESPLNTNNIYVEEVIVNAEPKLELETESDTETEIKPEVETEIESDTAQKNSADYNFPGETTLETTFSFSFAAPPGKRAIDYQTLWEGLKKNIKSIKRVIPQYPMRPEHEDGTADLREVKSYVVRTYAYIRETPGYEEHIEKVRNSSHVNWLDSLWEVVYVGDELPYPMVEITNGEVTEKIFVGYVTPEKLRE